jgi:hypothetical protein
MDKDTKDILEAVNFISAPTSAVGERPVLWMQITDAGRKAIAE